MATKLDVNLDDLVCHICLQQFEDPVTDVCGHTYCRDCIQTWFKTSSNCPVSRRGVDPSRLNANLLAKRLIGERQFRCQNREAGCSWIGTAREYHKLHKENCSMGEFSLTNFQKMAGMWAEEGVQVVRRSTSRGLLVALQGEEDKPYPGKLTYTDGRVYEGFLKDGLREGLGRLNDPEGVVTEGTWLNDKENGFFVIVKGEQVRFQGRMKEGVRDGPVTFFQGLDRITATYQTGVLEQPVKIKYADKGWYRGEVNDEFLPHGKGTRKQADHITMEAQFDNGVPVGEVKATFSDRTSFVGLYEADTQRYIGETTYPNQDKFTGTVIAGKKTGEGTFVTAKGEIYKGGWEDNQFVGKGSITFADKSVLEGEFAAGRIQGVGTKTLPSGIKVTGEVDMFHRVFGKGKVELPDGVVVEGPLNDNKVLGKGTIKFTNGDAYEGEIKNNMMDGHGEIKYANGNVFKGNLAKGIPVDEGSLTVPGEGTYTGRFVNGLLQGKVGWTTPQKKQLTVEFKKGVKVDPKARIPSSVSSKFLKDKKEAPKPEKEGKVAPRDVRPERLKTETDLNSKAKQRPRVPTAR